MATRALVERDVDQGSRLLHAIDSAGIPVEAMFWILADAWNYWFLVVVVPTQNAEARHESALQIQTLLGELEDVDYLLDKVAVVQREDWRYRAIKKRLREKLPHSNYHLGGFYAEDLEVLDSYVYRLMPKARRTSNGTSSRPYSRRNGTETKRKAPAASSS